MNPTADDWLDRPLVPPTPRPAAVAPLADVAATIATPPPDYQRMIRDWALLGLMAVMAWNWMRGGADTDTSPTPNVAGLRVLILEESADRAKLPAPQSAIFNAVGLREAIAARDGQLLVLDRHDDVAKLAQEWRQLRGRATLATPLVIFAAGRRAVEMPLPSSTDEFLRKLEAFR